MSAVEQAPFDEQNAFADILALMIAWGLPAGDVEYILRGALSLKELRPRDVLFAQGEPVSHIYLLKSGTLFQDRIAANNQGFDRVALRREILPGQLVGQYDLLYGQKHSTRTRALDFCQIIAVDATAVNRLLYAFPDLRDAIAPLSLIGRLRTLPLFEKLEATVLSLVAEVCERKQVEAGDVIYEASEHSDRVFVIDEGQVRLTSPLGLITWLGNGMSFGSATDALLEQPTVKQDISQSLIAEDALRYGHTATAAGTTVLFSWKRDTLIELTGMHPDVVSRDLRLAREQTIQSISVFANFTHSQRQKLIGYMSHYYFPTHHVVMQQGETGDSMWVLMPGSTGTLRALDGAQAMQPTTVYGPNYFSELSLRVEHPLDSTVQAEPGSQWLRLHKEDFQAFLKHTDPTLIDKLTLSPATERYLGHGETRKRYRWLGQTEMLITFQRRHILLLARKLFVSLFLFGLLFLLYALFAQMGWTNKWSVALLSLLTLTVVGYLLWIILDYLNDYILVTNHRVVHQEKILFMAEWRKAASLEQIRNIGVETSFFGRLLGYGKINIQTAATEGSIKFNYVPNPHALRQIILEQQSQRIQKYQASSKMVIQNLLQERLGLQLQIPPRVTGLHIGDSERDQGKWQRSGSLLLRKLRPPRTSSDELIVWRKHWLVLTRKIMFPLATLIFILMLVGGQQFLPQSWHNLVAALDIALTFIGLVTVLWILWNIADWRNDTYEVDNKQIADVEKKPLFFSEKRKTALLGDIENIEVGIPSPIHYLFNFGNVRIQTAATEGNFTFDWVSNPRGVSEEIRRRIEAYRQQQEDSRARQRAEELPDWFEMYDRLGVDLHSGMVRSKGDTGNG